MSKLESIPSFLCKSLVLLSFFLTGSLHAEILVKSGEKVAFLGDSITANGWKSYNGYVQLVVVGLEANGIKIEAIPAGVSGNKSNQMLARLDASVLSKHPDWMTLSCGVNDVWHSIRGDGIPLNDQEAESKDPNISGKPGVGTYEKNITAIIDQAQNAHIKPVILTATMIKEDLKNPLNKKLVSYNEFLVKLAKERNLPLADLSAEFKEKLLKDGKPNANVFTVDGVHMNPEGNKIMAVGVLKAFGLNDEELQKSREAWSKMVPPAPPKPKPVSAAPETAVPPVTPAAETPAPPTPAAPAETPAATDPNSAPASMQ